MDPVVSATDVSYTWIPPSCAAAAVFNSIILSPICTVVESTVVVVPNTSKFPAIDVDPVTSKSPCT